MNKPPQDYGIPMLTEVLEPTAHSDDGEDDIPELTQLISSPVSPTISTPVSTPTSPPISLLSSSQPTPPPRQHDDGVALKKEPTDQAAANSNATVAGNAATDFAMNFTPYRAPPIVTNASAAETESRANIETASEASEQNMIDDVLAPSSVNPNQSQDEEWALLQDQVTERVLAQIMRRIDSQLEIRVRDNLADVLQLAIHKLSEEIRTGLQHTLEDIINDAVKREITKVKFSKE